MRSIAPHMRSYPTVSGASRWVFERNGHRVRFALDAHEPWYSEQYMAALRSSGMPDARVNRIIQELPRSYARVLVSYKISREYRKLSSSHHRQFSLIADEVAHIAGWADAELTAAEEWRVISMRTRDPAAAVSAIRAVLRHGRAHLGLAADEPAAEISSHPPALRWSEADLDRFKRVVPAGSATRVALMLLLHTRRPLAQVATLGPDSIGRVHPELAQELRACLPSAGLYLLHPAGRQYTSGELSKMFRLAESNYALPGVSRAALSGLNASRVAETIAGGLNLEVV